MRFGRAGFETGGPELPNTPFPVVARSVRTPTTAANHSPVIRTPLLPILVFVAARMVRSTATSNVLTAASGLYAFSFSVVVLRQQHLQISKTLAKSEPSFIPKQHTRTLPLATWRNETHAILISEVAHLVALRMTHPGQEPLRRRNKAKMAKCNNESLTYDWIIGRKKKIITQPSQT